MKHPKSKSMEPKTIDEYLAAGVDFEEAGEKWRGGDTGKSFRFFKRAIDCYEKALNIFPYSFDLAYNKARAQYELTQHPKLLRLLNGSPLKHLQTALSSSKYALSLKPDNADALFNNAQVLTSIAEELDDECPNPDFPHPLILLEEALILFQKCLELQEALIKDSPAETTNGADERDSMDSDSDSDEQGVSIVNTSSECEIGSSIVQDDHWATIIEPVTSSTILDTIVASLETLTIFCNLLSPQNSQTLIKIQEFGQELNYRLQKYSTGSNSSAEIHVTHASFLCAFTTAQFRCSLINIPMSLKSIHNAFVNFSIDDNPRGLCEYAEALLAQSDAIRLYSSEEDISTNTRSRWEALTCALEYLSRASKLHNAENLEKIHLTRGDVELSRYQLGQLATPLRVAADNGRTLLINAGKYYRGSATLAEALGLQTLAVEARFKELLASGLAGNMEQFGHMREICQHEKNTIIKQSIDEGLVTSKQLTHLRIL